MAVDVQHLQPLPPDGGTRAAAAAYGLGNPAIAERLGISAKTVRNVVSNVLVKLQVADRAAAIARARDAGLGRR